jgi:hypothetical protein
MACELAKTLLNAELKVSQTQLSEQIARFKVSGKCPSETRSTGKPTDKDAQFLAALRIPLPTTANGDGAAVARFGRHVRECP